MSAIQSDIEQNASRAQMSGFPHESDSSLEAINGIQQRTNNYIQKVYETYIYSGGGFKVM